MCKGYSLRHPHAFISESLMTQALGRVARTKCHRVSMVSTIQASFDYSPVEKSLEAFAIFRGRYQVSPLAHQMLSAQNWLHCLPSAIERPPELWIRSSRTSFLSHRRSGPRLPSLLAPIREAFLASAENAPCDPLLVWRLCPSPSQVHHICQARPAKEVLHYHPRLPHPPHRRILHDPSDHLRSRWTSPQITFQAWWLSILRFQHFSFLPAPA